ncbi:MAG: hypothetical protein U1E73_04795 [Planctomycetota bacterium]
MTWTAAEGDTTGEFSARYDVVATDAAETTVRRTRLRYTAIAGQAELPKHAITGDGEATFARRIGWLVAARIDETTLRCRCSTCRPSPRATPQRR